MLKEKSVDSVFPDGLGEGHGTQWREKGVLLEQNENSSYLEVLVLC